MNPLTLFLQLLHCFRQPDKFMTIALPVFAESFATAYIEEPNSLTKTRLAKLVLNINLYYYLMNWKKNLFL